MSLSNYFSSKMSSYRIIIILCFLGSIVCFAFLQPSLNLVVFIFGISGIIFFANYPKLTLSLVGFFYPLMFIAINPYYEIFFSSLYASVWFCGAILVLLVLQKRILLKQGMYLVYLLLILMGAVLSSIVSGNESIIYRTVVVEYLMYIVLFLAAVNIIGKSKNIDFFITPFLCSLTLLSILLLIQFFFGYELVYYWTTNMIGNRSRLYYGEGVSLNMLANLYLFALPVLFFKVLLIKKISKVVTIYIVGFFINLTPFLLFQSRSGYVGLSFGLLLALILFKPIKIGYKTIIATALLFIVFYFVTESLQTYLLTDRLTGDTTHEDAAQRLVQAKAVWSLLLNHPFGITSQIYYANIGAYGGYHMSPHNLIFASMLKIGFLGVVGYLLLLTQVFLRLWKVRNIFMSNYNKAMVSSFFASFTAYIVHNLVHNPGYQFESWTFIGLSVAITSTVSMKSKNQSTSRMSI